MVTNGKRKFSLPNGGEKVFRQQNHIHTVYNVNSMLISGDSSIRNERNAAWVQKCFNFNLNVIVIIIFHAFFINREIYLLLELNQ